MANVYNSGTVYIDTTGAVVGRAAKVAYVLFTPGASGDALAIYDSLTTTTPIKLWFKGTTANNTMMFDFSSKPITFQAGIYITITSGATATLILTSEGAST